MAKHWERPCNLPSKRGCLLISVLVLCYFYNWILGAYWMMVSDCLCPKEYQDNIRFILKESVDTLEKQNIPYFLDQGTLLGAARHGNIIPHDSDCDLSVYERDMNKVYELLKSHATVVSDWQYNDGVYIIRVFRRRPDGLIDKDDPHIDIFWYTELGNGKLRYTHGGDFDVSLFEPPATLPIAGRPYFVPKEYKKILTEKFGPNYMDKSKVRFQDCKDAISIKLFGYPI